MPRRISSSSKTFRRRTAYLLAVLVAGIAALVATATPRLDVALEAQYQLVAERPYDAAVQNDLGNLLLLAGRDDAAAQAYSRALELDGSHVRARFNLGLLDQQNGLHQQALEQFERLLEIEPNHAWAHYQSGVSLQELDRRKDAVEQYARAFGLDPTLSFAENNPHIIDNTMVTEALLLSSRYGTTAARSVARQYDDAERIAYLMIEPEATDGESEESEEAMATQIEAEGEPVRRATTSSSGSRLDLNRDESADEEIFDDTQDEDRVITEDDIEGDVQTGGVVAVPSSRSRTDVRSRTNSRRGSGIDVRSSNRRQIDGRGAPSGNLDGQRYRPQSQSRRSSASLDLKLLPEETVEDVADMAAEGLG